jgi:small-conductance mechanosensitive channel
MNATDDAALVDFLRDRDVQCPRCAYNLRGLSAPRCPECGRPLELRVGITDQRLAAWLTGMIFLAAGSGAGILMLISVIADGWPGDSDPLTQRLATSAAILHILTIPALTAWLIYARRFHRLTRRVQWIGAALVILAVVGSIVLTTIVSLI